MKAAHKIVKLIIKSDKSFDLLYRRLFATLIS